MAAMIFQEYIWYLINCHAIKYKICAVNNTDKSDYSRYGHKVLPAMQ